MKTFKNLTLYCIIFIFILSLTSSFEMNNLLDQKFTNFSLKSNAMRDLFYGAVQSNEPDDEEGSDIDDSETNPLPEIQELSLGDSGEEVYKYEKILYYLDYIKTTPTGNFGETMVNAVKTYQEDKALDPTGNLDNATINSLLEESIIYKNGKSGNEILAYQLTLYYLDYMQVYPDGEYGNVTVNAVKAYQQSKGLTSSGDLDIETQESIKKEKVVYKKGKKGDIIKEYQNKLISLGYLQGTADGQYGNNTANAVKAYQEENDLEANGTIDEATQTALDSH
ncbi:MAG: peptidoglycan-binding domain-containing protein [Eubacteriales bacterium]